MSRYSSSFSLKYKDKELQYFIDKPCFSIFVNEGAGEFNNLEYIEVLIPFKESKLNLSIPKNYFTTLSDEAVVKYITILQRDLPIKYSTLEHNGNQFHTILLKKEDYPSFGAIRHTVDLIRVCYESGDFCHSLITKFNKQPKNCDWYIVLQLYQLLRVIKECHMPFIFYNKLITKDTLTNSLKTNRQTTGWQFYQYLQSIYNTTNQFGINNNYKNYLFRIVDIMLKPRKTKEDKQKIAQFYEFKTKFNKLTEKEKTEFYEANK